jgi:hypothetical protein
MNKRSNTAVPILIGLILVLPCVAQTSQAEKEILDWSRRSAAIRENVDCFHQAWSGSRICSIVRFARADRPERRYRSREFPTARQKPAPL